jgi:hypothetical protein
MNTNLTKQVSLKELSRWLRKNVIEENTFHQRKQKDSCTLRMGPIGCPETSVRNNHYSMCNNPEEGSSQNKESWMARQSQESQQSLANIR